MQDLASGVYGTVFILDRDHAPDDLRQQFGLMRSLGMNTVVFWPPHFFDNGQPTFDRHRTAMDIAHEQGLRVVLEIFGQVADLEFMPDCEYRDEYNVVDRFGLVQKAQGGLGELNYNHPDVRSALERVTKLCAAAYKDHPALIAWDIFNETHFQSFDRWTVGKFQSWLEHRYGGDISQLNRAWNKSYTAFAQVHVDPGLWAAIAPALDWDRFRIENLAQLVADLRRWVHEVDPDRPVIADNVLSNVTWNEGGSRGTDDWLTAANTDVYGISFYPKTGGRLLSDDAPWLRSLTLSGARSASSATPSQRFLISELQSGVQSELYTLERVTPAEIIWWNLEAISHGSLGQIYWKWAPFRRGWQVGGRGLVLADGSPSRRAEAAGRIGRLLADHPQIMQSAVRDQQVALVFDAQSMHGIRGVLAQVGRIIGMNQLHHAMFGVYRGCVEAGVVPRILTPDQLAVADDLPDLLVLPYQLMLSDSAAAAVRRHVEQGGTVMTSYPFNPMNLDGELHPDQPGGPLNDLLAVRRIDHLDFPEGVVRFSDGTEVPFESSLPIEELELRQGAGLKVLAEVEGLPLVIEHAIGEGHWVHLTGPLWQRLHEKRDEAAQAIFDRCIGHRLRTDVQVDLPTQVTVADLPDASLVFVFNYGGLKRIALHSDTLDLGSASILFGEGKITVEERHVRLAGGDAAYVLRVGR